MWYMMWWHHAMRVRWVHGLSGASTLYVRTYFYSLRDSVLRFLYWYVHTFYVYTEVHSNITSFVIWHCVVPFVLNYNDDTMNYPHRKGNPKSDISSWHCIVCVLIGVRCVCTIPQASWNPTLSVNVKTVWVLVRIYNWSLYFRSAWYDWRQRYTSFYHWKCQWHHAWRSDQANFS